MKMDIKYGFGLNGSVNSHRIFYHPRGHTLSADPYITLQKTATHMQNKRFTYSFFSSCVIFFILGVTQLHAFEQRSSTKLSLKALQAVPNEILVKFKNTDSTKRSKPALYKANATHHYSALQIERWVLAPDQNLEQTLEKLKQDPNVEFAEPNIRRFPKTERLNNRVRARNDESGDRLAQVNLPELWQIPVDNASTKNKIRIAVLDDAFDLDHPEFAENIILPFDALDNDENPSPESCDSEFSSELETHGTLVLGVLAANGITVEGAADYAEFIPIRLGCEYLLSAELAAYEHAIANDVDIISLSWGGPRYSALERDAIFQLGKKNILVVTAAGNWEVDNDRIPDYPSSIDLPNILSVAASDKNDNLTDWTQYGATSVDIAAPGENFTTTEVNASYRSVDGTSFSAPLVAGVAASIMARDSSASVYDVKAALIATAQPFADNLQGRLVVDGYVDAIAAYNFLQDSEMSPVVVINQITIDDSAGNGDGEVDDNERVNLNITLENLSSDVDTLRVELFSNSLELSPPAQTFSGFKGFDHTNFIASRIEKRFAVSFGSLLFQQNAIFTLEGSGVYQSGKTFSFSRSFTLDIGRLVPNIPVNTIIRAFDDGQDDVHYYHVYLPIAAKELKITLDSGIRDLDIIVKKDDAPDFNYSNYWIEPEISGGVEEGAIISAGLFGLEEIVINNPSLGTYYIAVVVPPDTFRTDIAYMLEARVNLLDSEVMPLEVAIGASSEGSDSVILRAFISLPLLFALFSLISGFRYRSLIFFSSSS